MANPIPAPELSLPISMFCNNIETRVCFALQGLAMACLPAFSIRAQLAHGSLRATLVEPVERAGIFPVLWPASRHPSPNVRARVDFLCARRFPDAKTGCASELTFRQVMAGSFAFFRNWCKNRQKIDMRQDFTDAGQDWGMAIRRRDD